MLFNQSFGGSLSFNAIVFAHDWLDIIYYPFST